MTAHADVVVVIAESTADVRIDLFVVDRESIPVAVENVLT